MLIKYQSAAHNSGSWCPGRVSVTESSQTMVVLVRYQPRF